MGFIQRSRTGKGLVGSKEVKHKGGCTSERYFKAAGSGEDSGVLDTESKRTYETGRLGHRGSDTEEKVWKEE